MYIFVDESGTHMQTGNSSVVLVYIAVADITKAQEKVLETERKLSLQSFHWSHSMWNVRESFFNEIVNIDFTLKVALIKNPFLAKQAYQLAFSELITEEVSALIIDGKKGKQYEQKLKKILRDNNVSIRKLKTADDKKFPALRIADMCAAIIRLYDENQHKKVTKKILF